MRSSVRLPVQRGRFQPHLKELPEGKRDREHGFSDSAKASKNQIFEDGILFKQVAKFSLLFLPTRQIGRDMAGTWPERVQKLGADHSGGCLELFCAIAKFS